jgi:hypothetical protein
VDYALLDRYFLGVIIRQDKGLRGEWRTIQPFTYFDYYAHKAFYPSVMAGWSISNEPFMKKISWINQLKIRGSYGKTGDVNANWQYSEMTDIGFDSRFIKNQFGLSMDWYSNIGRNVSIPVNVMTDFNTGENKFTGTDIDINYNNSWNDFGFSASLAFSSYRSRINKIHNLSDYYYSGPFTHLQYIVQNRAGHAPSAFYGYRVEGIFHDDDEVSSAPDQPGSRPGSFRYANMKDPDDMIDFNDQTFIGDPNPDFTAGLNIDITWKNMDLNVLFFTSQGNDVFNYTKYYTDFWFPEMGQKSKDLLYNSWTETNRDADIPIASQQTYQDITSYYIEDGSYLRIKNLQLGYNFSPDRLRSIKLSGLRVYIQAVNLFTITNYSGLDPEVGGTRDAFGIDMGNYPNTKQFIIGLQAEI